MGGLFHLLNFNQASTSPKFPTHKRHIDGLEAPRNSLELPIETSQSYRAMGDKIPYSHQMNHKASKHNRFLNGVPMKKLINEEISKESDSRRNVPSVVARLMGMDILPSEIKPAIHVRERQSKTKQNNFPRKEQLGSSSYLNKPLDLEPYKHITHDLLPDLSSHSLKLGKPQSREHPQEEQLQKFKKEFEAWQAARVWEQSRFVEGPHKEKSAINSDSRRIRGNEKITEVKSHNSQLTVKSSTKERGGLHHHRYKGEEFQANQKESMILRNRNKTDIERLMNCDPKKSKYSVPRRIVILKPGHDRSPGSEESWAGASATTEEEGSIENFLEEVKERLRFEMQGKVVKREFVVIRDGIEIPFYEKPSNPRKIAQNIAKQVRESVSRDFGVKLLRSESLKSYGSEIQVGGPESPEFINRETRKLLSERLRNVLKEDADVAVATIGSKNSLARDVFSSGKRCYWENVKDEPEIQTRSFRHGEKKNCQVHHAEEMPRRNLVRSLSAPVSGTSFGKLLLEDRHVLTGAHIRRKHEIAENVSVEVTKTTKEKFSLGGKVSNLKCNFTLKSRLFGRKMQLEEEIRSNESVFVRDDFMSGPTVMMNLGSAQENSTEVPPSPASVCSSIHEEFCEQADFPSPVSAIDACVMEDSSVLKGSGDINPNLSDVVAQTAALMGTACVELRKQLNPVEELEERETKELEKQPLLEAELMPEKAYIRDLLVVSGLYDGSGLSSAGSVSRWVPLGNWAFDKVEEPYRGKTNMNGGGDTKDRRVDGKVLFDLSNEALATILGPYSEANKDDGMIIRPTRMPPPRGKKLLDDVWRMIHIYVYPPDDHDHHGSSSSFYSLDSIVARELGMTPWFHENHFGDNVDVVGRVIEGFILEGLIEETLREMASNVMYQYQLGIGLSWDVT
ncbi:protein of unknown function DUF4378 [Macleaya cordata]|uniref:DUF4378 domain-containing protein n=1 Tax=Macleaya cordata TaxID=56857 RepID=A0A200PR10_MACCD|nr:protein of unknown function DUF4378 [Macleaya cordata]